jgi:hypothetical protein
VFCQRDSASATSCASDADIETLAYLAERLVDLDAVGNVLRLGEQLRALHRLLELLQRRVGRLARLRAWLMSPAPVLERGDLVVDLLERAAAVSTFCA